VFKVCCSLAYSSELYCCAVEYAVEAEEDEEFTGVLILNDCLLGGILIYKNKICLTLCKKISRKKTEVEERRNEKIVH
jgi:hypothetical protein